MRSLSSWKFQHKHNTSLFLKEIIYSTCKTKLLSVSTRINFILWEMSLKEISKYERRKCGLPKNCWDGNYLLDPGYLCSCFICCFPSLVGWWEQSSPVLIHALCVRSWNKGLMAGLGLSSLFWWFENSCSEATRGLYWLPVFASSFLNPESWWEHRD